MDSTAISEAKQTDLVTLAVEINEHHRLAEEAASSALEHAYQAGLLLNRARRQCQHGEWLKWLKSNFAGSVRTAQVYMQIGDPFNWERIQKRNGVAHLRIEKSELVGVRKAVKLLAKPKPVVVKEAVDVDDHGADDDQDDDRDVAPVDDHDHDDHDVPTHVEVTTSDPCPRGGEHDWEDDGDERYCRKCKDPGAPVDQADVKKTVQLTRAQKEAKEIIELFRDRLNKVGNNGMYTLESLSQVTGSKHEANNFILQCAIAPHVEVHRTYGRKGLCQYQFVCSEAMTYRDRIRELAQRILSRADSDPQSKLDAAEILLVTDVTNADNLEAD